MSDDMKNVVAARPIKQPITVRATWKAGEKTCDLLRGESNVLVTEYEFDGEKRQSDPCIPPQHLFAWRAVEIVTCGELRHASASFQFSFGPLEWSPGVTNYFLNVPAELVADRELEVAFALEESPVQPTVAGEVEGEEWKADAARDQDTARLRPLTLMPLENFNARLVANEPPSSDLHLVFVLHGVLVKPLTCPCPAEGAAEWRLAPGEDGA